MSSHTASLIFACIVASLTVACAIIFGRALASSTSAGIGFFVTILIMMLGFFIMYFFTINDRTYLYDGHTIRVRAGWYDHYLQIDGQIVDRIKTPIAFSLELTGDIDGKSVRAKIGMSNGIIVFVGGTELNEGAPSNSGSSSTTNHLYSLQRSEKAMYCPHCGKPYDQSIGATFCRYCGRQMR